MTVLEAVMVVSMSTMQTMQALRILVSSVTIGGAEHWGKALVAVSLKNNFYFFAASLTLYL